MASSDVPLWRPLFVLPPLRPCPFGLSPVSGCGHDEQSLAPHGVSGFGRAEYSRRNAVAQSLQCRDEGGELLACVPRHVLSDDKTRPALLGDPDNLWSEEAFAACSGALSCD